MAKSSLIVRHKGDFSATFNFLKKKRQKTVEKVLNELGQMGVDALSAATPVKTGKTAASWHYAVVTDSQNRTSIHWYNDNTTRDGDNIVLLLVNGHGTRDKHYVKGRDFVTPAIEPIFDTIANKAWLEVTK